VDVKAFAVGRFEKAVLIGTLAHKAPQSGFCSQKELVKCHA
jgi:hypothetical protein